jgi:hypothetical protein
VGIPPSALVRGFGKMPSPKVLKIEQLDYRVERISSFAKSDTSFAVGFRESSRLKHHDCADFCAPTIHETDFASHPRSPFFRAF